MTVDDKTADGTGAAPAVDFDRACEQFFQLYQAQWPDATIEAHGQELRVTSVEKLRPNRGNHPAILHHGRRTRDVIVLVHGITDSPHYVEALGRRFHREGFTVVLPLLPAHGLKRPWPAMRSLEHTDWIRDVDAVLSLSRGLGERVSLGGFSTGGALAIRKATLDPDAVDGALYLFSAALDIGGTQQFLLDGAAGPALGRILDGGKFVAESLKEKILEIRRAVTRQDEPEDAHFGIGDNPCKYSVFFFEGATELAEVIEEIEELYEARDIPLYSDIRQPVFLAHSRTDVAAKFEGAQQLYDAHAGSDKMFHVIDDLLHASVVLEEPIAEDPENAPANPDFEALVTDMLAFTREFLR